MRLGRNSAHYYASEIMEFVYIDDEQLDAGYTLLLKHQAWIVGKGIEAQAVSSLCQGPSRAR